MINTPTKQLLAALALVCLGATARAQISDGVSWTLDTGYSLRYHGPVGVPENQRHTVTSSGIHHFWCYNTDDGGSWKPRSEVSMNPDYGLIRQFEAKIKVKKGTHQWSIWQIHTSNSQPQHGSTAGMIWYRNTDGGSLYWYGSGPFATGLDDKEFRLNVIHNTANNEIKVYVNGSLKITKTEQNPSASLFYHQFGVYAQSGASATGECWMWGIKRWKKK